MELIFDHDEAQLWYDHKYQILKAIWYGDVGLEAFSGLVLTGATIVEQNPRTHMLFDRSRMQSFKAESRVWFKRDFMSSGGDGRRLIKKIHRIAAVKTTSSLGQIASTMFSKLLIFFNPKLEYRIFDNIYDAERWIRGFYNTNPSAGKTLNSAPRQNLFYRMFGF